MNSDSEFDELIQILEKSSFIHKNFLVNEVFQRRVNLFLKKEAIPSLSFLKKQIKNSEFVLNYFIDFIFPGETQLFRNIEVWKNIFIDSKKYIKHQGEILFSDCPTSEEYISFEIIKENYCKDYHIPITITTPTLSGLNTCTENKIHFQKIENTNKLLINNNYSIHLHEYLIEKNKYHYYKNETQKNIKYQSILEPLPSSQYSFIISRNRLVYYTEETCHKIIFNWYKTLKINGYLLIGTHENLDLFKNTGFVVENKEYRLLRKI